MEFSEDWVAQQATRYQDINALRRAARTRWTQAQLARGLVVKRSDCPESALPQYDNDARQGWAAYRRMTRGRGGGLNRSAKDHECGTASGYWGHINRRRKLRRKGYTPTQVNAMEPIDEACRETQRT